MKTVIGAIALTAVAIAAPIGATQAHTFVTVGIDTPGFGIRIGAPYPLVAPLPVYRPAPVYVAAPVYAPPIVYLPPRMVVGPPVVYPIVYPYGPPAAKHRKHGKQDARRVIVPGGYVYGRY